MSTITDIMVLVHPAADATGIILADTVWILFNQEIDEKSITEGNLLVTGPDTDSFIGPDMGFNLPNISDSGDNDQLNSPGYAGIVPGKISFQQINLTDLNVYTGATDTGGAGNLWRTKAIFTPSFPLQVETDYTIYLAGDENSEDVTIAGVRSRTVFDPISLGGNTGTGTISFGGSYLGPINDTYHVKISTAGASGIAWYTWWVASAPSTIYGPVLSDAYQSQLLNNGVTVKLLTGDFLVNDEFTVIVKTPTIFSDNTYWTFTTGSGSIQAVPTTTSTSITGDPTSVILTTPFSVSSIVPADRATNLSLTTNRITLTFNKNIDPTTVTADTVLLTGVPVNGDETLLADRTIYKNITVTGNKIILDF